MAARDLRIHLRHSTIRPNEVPGYAVAPPGDANAKDEPVLYGGGQLAADLTVPRLRRRWAAGPRLTGRAMNGPAARLTLAREALRAARMARTESDFVDGLGRAGLLVRLRPDPDRPGRPAGYALSLPGLNDRAGQPVWFGGGTLDPQLRLGALRARSQAGRSGAGPGPDVFTGANAAEIYAHAVIPAESPDAHLTVSSTSRDCRCARPGSEATC